jgi:predicted transcriptional regulator
MRASEFISAQLNEIADARISRRLQSATRGLNVYSDAERWNSDYVLSRLGQAVASTDGTFVPEIDAKSWIGKNKSTHPYTREEQAMLKKAYEAIGADYQDLNGGDMDSEEMSEVNKVSPVKGFRGYPR